MSLLQYPERSYAVDCGVTSVAFSIFRPNLLAVCLSSRFVAELLMTNRKSHMRFRLAPRWMTLNCYKFQFSQNFTGSRSWFGSQQRL